MSHLRKWYISIILLLKGFEMRLLHGLGTKSLVNITLSALLLNILWDACMLVL